MVTKRAGKPGVVQMKLEKEREHSGPADWASVNGSDLVKTLEAVALAGGALRLGYTRDGGAYAIGIYGDGEPYTVYIRPSEDIDRALANIREAFEDLRFRQPNGKKD